MLATFIETGPATEWEAGSHHGGIWDVGTAKWDKQQGMWFVGNDG